MFDIKAVLEGDIPPSVLSVIEDVEKVARQLPWNLGLVGAVHKEKRRDNVRKNLKLGLPLLQVADEHSSLASIACYGPSLKDSLHDLKGDICTVSGAHDYLISHGIVPKYHVEMDPRVHKSDFLKSPHKDVTYLIASCCDPSLLKNLDGHNVALWHLNSYEKDDDAFYEDVTPGYFNLDIGCSVGLAAMTVMGILGYRTEDVFGMDCSKKDGERHAGQHNGPFQRSICVSVGDRVFDTTPQMVSAARDFMSLVKRMGQVNVTVHGDGLLPHWIDSIMEKENA